MTSQSSSGGICVLTIWYSCSRNASLACDRTLELACRHLEAVPAAARGPLHGVPFAVKDNIDAEGFSTTAACEAFRYTPGQSAPIVQALVDAGARCLRNMSRHPVFPERPPQLLQERMLPACMQAER